LVSIAARRRRQLLLGFGTDAMRISGTVLT
jgi:hypothetical protein